MFSADPSGASASDPGHFRISFSHAEVTDVVYCCFTEANLVLKLQFEDLKKAVEILARVLKKFYRDF